MGIEGKPFEPLDVFVVAMDIDNNASRSAKHQEF